MLPRRTDPTDPLALADEGVDPEAELRARLLIYRAHRDAGLRLAEDALRRIGSFRREPSVARAAALAGARPVDAPPLDPAPSRACAGPAGGDRRADRAAARDHGPHDHHHRARRDHPGRPARRPAGRPPGPPDRRARPGRDRDHVPGHAGAHEAARDRGRAGDAVGSDRRPRDDGRGAGRRRGLGRAIDAPIDESLESFA